MSCWYFSRIGSVCCVTSSLAASTPSSCSVRAQSSVSDTDGGWLAPRNLLYGTDVLAADGHSDYGNVFERFWHLYGYADLDPRSTVIITGDARNNYREAGAQTLRAIGERSRHLYWLNPEPRERWDTTDSIMTEFEPMCTGAYEVRNLRQLTDFVLEIA